MSRAHIDGSCTAGIGSFVIINDEGWIITAAHIIAEDLKLNEAKAEYVKYLDMKTQIKNDNGLLSDQKKKKIKKLGTLNPKGVTDYSFWWAGDGTRVVDIHAFGTPADTMKGGDIAVGRLEPFDPKSVTNYPVFKDATKPIPSGTSLCRLGFPFHEISPNYSSGKFILPPGTLPVVFFPNEGILTRVIAVDQNPATFVAFIETSSPGLLGQSGGPIFDNSGTVWGIQSHTSHLPLGFSPAPPGGKPGEREHQFLNVGRGAHPATVARLLTEAKIKHAVSAY